MKGYFCIIVCTLLTTIHLAAADSPMHSPRNNCSCHKKYPSISRLVFDKLKSPRNSPQHSFHSLSTSSSYNHTLSPHEPAIHSPLHDVIHVTSYDSPRYAACYSPHLSPPCSPHSPLPKLPTIHSPECSFRLENFSSETLNIFDHYKLWKEPHRLLDKKRKTTFLMFAAMHNYPDNALRLLAATKKLQKSHPSKNSYSDNLIDKADAQGKTALIHAAENDNFEAIKALLSYNANINAQDNLGKTPLMYTIENNNFDTTLLILKDVPDVTIRDKKNKDARQYAIKGLFELELNKEKLIARWGDIIYKQKHYEKTEVARIIMLIETEFIVNELEQEGLVDYNAEFVPATQKNCKKQEMTLSL